MPEVVTATEVRVSLSTPVQSREQRTSKEEDDDEGLYTPRISQRISTAAKGRPSKHKVKHRKQKQGQTIFKGHPSWAIMNNIKLGVHYTVSKASSASVDASRPLTLKDFTVEVRQSFPPEGSSQTPAHGSEEFTYRDAAPLAFRHLREHFGVSAEDYMVSICGENNLRELGTPGKSGSVFYLTEDGKYMIKTVSRKESKFLRRILPNYYNYVMRSTSTFIPRFFGLMRITTASHRRIRLVIFNNLLPMDYFIHEKFDLKGSTLGRWATEKERADPNVTLKDLDFDHSLELKPDVHAAFKAQLESDTAWLRSLLIMDYSLLVMLHFPVREGMLPTLEHAAESMPEAATRFAPIFEEKDAPSPKGASPRPKAATLESPQRRPPERVAPGGPRFDPSDALDPSDADAVDVSDPGMVESETSVGEPDRGSQGVSVAETSVGEFSSCSAVTASSGAGSAKNPASTKGSTKEGSGKGSPPVSGKSAAADDDEADDAEFERLNLPRVNDADLAQAYHTRMSYIQTGSSLGAFTHGSSAAAGVAFGGGRPAPYWRARTATGETVLVFAGLIDILQIYGARKKLEHQYKSMVHWSERDGISVTDPVSYAGRLATFVLSKFVPIPRADGEAEASDGAGTASSSAAGGVAPTAVTRAGTIAALGEAPAVSGMIQKKGAHFPFAWSPRYAEVYGASKLLVYYHSQAEKLSGQPPRGQRALVALSEPSEGSSESSLVVTVLTADPTKPNGRGSHAERTASQGALTKPLLLKFASKGERDTWRAVLGRVLGEPNAPVPEPPSPGAASMRERSRTNSVVGAQI